jgi:hypothetical protein
MQAIMKKTVTVLALLGSLIIILSSFQFGHAITMFLLAGLIPGTDIIVSPDQMFSGIALIAGFSLSVLVTSSVRRLVGVKRHNTLRP